jgi:hypothetical protein
MTEDTNSCTVVVAKVKWFDDHDNEICEEVLKKPIRVWDKDSITLTTIFRVIPT